MKKIVKFKKDHVAGFKKDDVRQLNKNTADRLIADGYAIESTEKEYCVNTYIILLNASKYKHAELLRETYKEQSGTDLADDIHWASQ